MGKSGSGKTTLLNILSTIDDLTKGKLFIYGKNIYEMSETEPLFPMIAINSPSLTSKET